MKTVLQVENKEISFEDFFHSLSQVFLMLKREVQEEILNTNY